MIEYEILYKSRHSPFNCVEVKRTLREKLSWSLYFKTKDIVIANRMFDEIKSARTNAEAVKIVEVRRKIIKAETC